MKERTMDGNVVINIETVLERLNGNRSMLAVLANYFLEDAPRLLEQLHEGVRTNSLSQIFADAHSLRGLASTFEPTPVAKIAAEIEKQSRQGESRQLPELTSQLDEEFARLMEALQVLSNHTSDQTASMR